MLQIGRSGSGAGFYSGAWVAGWGKRCAHLPHTATERLLGRSWNPATAPRALAFEQAPGFDKAEGGVSQGAEREQTELRVCDVKQQPREDVRMRIRGIEVKMPHEFVGDVLGVKVRKRQHAAFTDEHERAFCCLEERDGPE